MDFAEIDKASFANLNCSSLMSGTNLGYRQNRVGGGGEEFNRPRW